MAAFRLLLIRLRVSIALQSVAAVRVRISSGDQSVWIPEVLRRCLIGSGAILLRRLKAVGWEGVEVDMNGRHGRVVVAVAAALLGGS